MHLRFFKFTMVVFTLIFCFTVLTTTANGGNGSGRETAPMAKDCFNADGTVCSYGNTCVAGDVQCWSNPCNAGGCYQ